MTNGGMLVCWLTDWDQLYTRCQRSGLRRTSLFFNLKKYYISYYRVYTYYTVSTPITCVSVSLRERANSALSAIDRYCFSANFLSSPSSCCVLNGVLGWRVCFWRRSSLPFTSSHSRDNDALVSAIRKRASNNKILSCNFVENAY